MPVNVTIKVEGIEKLRANFDKMEREINQTVGAAGKESAEVILNTEGLRRYPPSTEANQPPTPYYIRGVGMQYANHNNGKSERYGTQWTVESSGFVTTIGNSASYAPFLGGDPPAKPMARIGWRSLVEVANEKIPKVTAIYQGWINRLINKFNL